MLTVAAHVGIIAICKAVIGIAICKAVVVLPYANL